MPTEAALATAAEQWRTDGWALVEGLVPAEVIAEARAEIELLDVDAGGNTRPSRTLRDDDDPDGPRFRTEQFSGTVVWPFRGAPNLNRLLVNQHVVDFARLAMQCDDIRIYQSRLWSKFAGRVNYEQPLHRDLNHSLVPTRSEPGWWHLECFLYLSDVDRESGAPRLVPRSASGGEPDAPYPVGPDEAPELYAREIPAEGGAGSLLAYRSDVWHRGVDITRPGAERHVLVVAFKPAGVEWIGYDPHQPLAINADFAEFASTCGPEELGLFGVPPPGHPYWTSQMIDAMQSLYRGLDVSPWREAVDRRTTGEPGSST